MDNHFCLRMADKRLRTYLPADLCETVGITPGSPVAFSVENGRLIAEHAVVGRPTTTARGYQRELALACVRTMNAETLAELREALLGRPLELAEEKQAGKREDPRCWN